MTNFVARTFNQKKEWCSFELHNKYTHFVIVCKALLLRVNHEYMMSDLTTLYSSRCTRVYDDAKDVLVLKLMVPLLSCQVPNTIMKGPRWVLIQRKATLWVLQIFLVTWLP